MVKLASLLVAAALASTTAQPSLEAFDRVYLDGAVTLNLTQGVTPALEISGDDDERVQIEIVDGVMYVDATALEADSDEVHIDLRLTNLTELVARGANRVVGTDLEVDSLTVEGGGEFKFDDLSARELLVISEGATDFEVSGRVEHQVVDAAGAVDYEASSLETRTSEVQLAGAGRLALWVEEMLAVRIAGSATVSYRGSPRVHERVLGAGKVRQVH